jgi:hypothetical protein
MLSTPVLSNSGTIDSLAEFEQNAIVMWKSVKYEMCQIEGIVVL